MAETYFSEKQLSTFCGSLAMMLHSGVSIQEAMRLFAQEEIGVYAEKNEKFSSELRRVAASMDQALACGESFTEAAKETSMFPEYTLEVFRAAELSGRLDDAMEHLAGYYDWQNRLYERIRSTVVYPLVLMLLMCVVLAVLVFGVLPMFMRVYGSIAGSLEASSFAYVPAARIVGWISLILSTIIGLGLLVLVLTMRTPQGRDKLRRPMERSRFTRHAIRLLGISQMTGTAATLLSSGASEMNALEFCLHQTQYAELKKILETCRDDMDQGTMLVQSLVRRRVLPGLYGQMLLSGEESGQLPQAMKMVSYRLEQEAEDALCGVIDCIEPVLTGYLTLAVGFTLLSVMLPLLGVLSGM